MRRWSIGVALSWIACVSAALGCGSSAPDAAFATPRATIMTLLRTHHLDRAPQSEIKQRMSRHDDDRFGVIDQSLMDRCFDDFDTKNPLHHGLAGFVVGALAAQRDLLAVRIEGETATVQAGGSARIVLHRRADGWKISLAESVPRSYHERMENLYESAKRQSRPR